MLLGNNISQDFINRLKKIVYELEDIASYLDQELKISMKNEEKEAKVISKYLEDPGKLKSADNKNEILEQIAQQMSAEKFKIWYTEHRKEIYNEEEFKKMGEKKKKSETFSTAVENSSSKDDGTTPPPTCASDKSSESLKEQLENIKNFEI